MSYIFQTEKIKPMSLSWRFKLLPVLYMMLISLPALAQETFRVDEIRYTVLTETPNTVEVSEYLYRVAEKAGTEAVVVPETVDYEGSTYTVVSIADKAFNSTVYTSQLKSIELPQSITQIGDYAFCDCKKLQSISVPGNVLSIGEGAFDRCESLSLIELPERMQSIGKYAFGDCSSLKNITLPEGIEDIGPSMFANCTSLESLAIPGTVKLIDAWAFASCSSLTNLFIPSSVESIVLNALSNCYSLSKIEVEDGNPTYSSEGGMLFNTDKTKLVLYPSAKGEVIIPNGIETIGSSAFTETRLVKIILPPTLKLVESYALGNYDLRTIECYAPVPPEVKQSGFSSGIQDGRPPLDIYVRNESYDYYVNASYWNYYKLYTMSGWGPYPPYSGVNGINGEVSEPERFVVYGIDGTFILDTADKDVVNSLPKGIYIINGEKIVF